MKKQTAIVGGVVVLLLSCVTSRADEKKGEVKLWAAISVNEPVFRDGYTKDLQMDFAVVNDGQTTIDPKTNSSHLFINGEELKSWQFIAGNGPRSGNYNALPPGDSTSFGYALGDLFEKPGVYKVRWEGENFKAPEIMFRVMPKPNK